MPLGGQACTAMDQGFDSLWIAVCSTPGPGAAAGRPRPGGCWRGSPCPDDLEVMAEGSVASGEGFVWVVTVGDERTLVKIDPTSNAVVDRVPVEVGVTRGSRRGGRPVDHQHGHRCRRTA